MGCNCQLPTINRLVPQIHQWNLHSCWHLFTKNYGKSPSLMATLYSWSIFNSSSYGRKNTTCESETSLHCAWLGEMAMIWNDQCVPVLQETFGTTIDNWSISPSLSLLFPGRCCGTMARICQESSPYYILMILHWNILGKWICHVTGMMVHVDILG
jgi:hypothetical protein